MRSVGNARHHGAKKEVISRKRQQALQSGLDRTGRHGQAAQAESGDQRSRNSEKIAPEAPAPTVAGCHHRLTMLPAIPQAV